MPALIYHLIEAATHWPETGALVCPDLVTKLRRLRLLPDLMSRPSR